MDLLLEVPPPRYPHRYDLESMFYIFICTCAVLDLRKKFWRWLLWERESLLDIGNTKISFLLGSRQRYSNILAHCDHAFKPLSTMRTVGSTVFVASSTRLRRRMSRSKMPKLSPHSRTETSGTYTISSFPRTPPGSILIWRSLVYIGLRPRRREMKSKKSPKMSILNNVDRI